ncbi:MAG: OmpH family outer membrane protein [Muribaculaceae bacterium]|nr:OmpH family outer membrane protein [Muribaculaceae bacterium]
MKKSALSAALLLLAFFGFTACSGSGDNTPAVSSKAPKEGLINIRYYNSDSVSKHYTLVQELNEQAQQVMNEYQAVERQRQNELQGMAASIQNKVQTNAYLSEQAYNADMASAQNRQQAIERELAAKQQAIAEQAAKQQQQLVDSVNNFLNAYAKVNKFDAILVQTAAMPGQYFNPELDITDEVIKGLNDRYKKAEKKAAANDDQKADDKKEEKK